MTPPPPAQTVFINGKIFQSGVSPGTNAGLHRPPTFASCMLIRGDQVEHVGSASDAPIAAALADATVHVHDLQGRTILPGFVDGHMRMTMAPSCYLASSIESPVRGKKKRRNAH